MRRLEEDIRQAVVDSAFLDEEIRPDGNTRVFINPDGPFIVGGPSVHSGLTGRKTAIDTYGEYSRQSGAALSGKDPLRIDRIGAYARLATRQRISWLRDSLMNAKFNSATP